MKQVFTIISAIVLVVCLLICGGLGLIGIQASREASRRMECSSNFKLIGLGIHNYHAAYMRLPVASGGTGFGTNESNGNQYRLSGHVALLPFIEQQALWDQIANPYPSDNPQFPQMGPAPWDSRDAYLPFSTNIQTFTCPSGPITTAGTSYAFCYGDTVEYVGASVYQIALMIDPEADSKEYDELKRDRVANRYARAIHRGTFANNRDSRFRDILDGLSNTIAMCEIRRETAPSKHSNAWVAKDIDGLIESPVERQNLVGSQGEFSEGSSLWPETRGYHWADGNIRSTGCTTILPPNSASCSTPRSEFEGIYSAGSLHLGGTHVLMGDGAVVYITETIDSGNPGAPTVFRDGTGGSAPGRKSPYGIWGALGTRAQKESIEERLSQ